MLSPLSIRVEEVPKLGALVLGVPLAEGIAETVDALLGAANFSCATGALKPHRTAAQGVQQARVQHAPQVLRLQFPRFLRPMGPQEPAPRAWNLFNSRIDKAKASACSRFPTGRNWTCGTI